jgi:rod shape-determining protein MreC
VISSLPGPYARTLVIAVGKSSGIQANAPVVSGDGLLVGIVSAVYPQTADVQLLSDPRTYVAALDLQTNASGGVRPRGAGALILDQVNKQLAVHPGDTLVTQGTIDPCYPDLYPAGIPIGTVTFAQASDTATFLQVELQPFADLSSLQAVSVLVSTKKPPKCT